MPWTMIEESAERPEGAAAQLLDSIAFEIESLERQAEYRRFSRDPDDYVPCRGCDDPDCDDCEGAGDPGPSQSDLRLNLLYAMLEHAGARMMRPYEHWGEEERMVEYLENRYDSLR